MARLAFRASGGTLVAAVTVGVGLAAFGVGMAGAPPTSSFDVTQATRNDWRDLVPRPDKSAQDLAVLVNRRPWGVSPVDPAAAAAAAASAASSGAGAAGALQGVTNSVPWRVTGVARQGSRYLAVLTQNPAGQAVKSGFLQVGEKLPDGRQITAIDADAIEVDGASGRQRIRLYWPKT